MSVTTVSTAAVSHAPTSVRARATSPATNLEGFSSPLVTARMREAINAFLGTFGAEELRTTHATETVARKAIRVALREVGFEARAAREMAVDLVASARA